MKKTFVLVVMVAAGCSPSTETRQNSLMDRVEQHVQMPSDARPISKYARYYALNEHRRVVAIYVSGPLDRVHDLPAGKRRWLGDYHNLPLIMDGGCSVVEVQFDPATDKVDASCNGLA